MSRRTDERLASDLPQHAYAQSAHAGCVFEVRARTFADGSGSYVQVVVHAPANAPHEQSAEYLTDDATAAGALRSGIAIAKSMMHHLPVVDAERRLSGMVTQSDLMAALYRSQSSLQTVKST